MLKRCVAAAEAVGRTLIALGVLAALFLPAFRPPAAVVAAAEPEDPAARLQVVVKSVYIRDDRDIGSGGMNLGVRLWKIGLPDLVSGGESFSADSGDTVTLGRVVPQAGDHMDGRSVSEATGIAVYAGEHYRLEFAMWERDPTAAEIACAASWMFAFGASCADDWMGGLAIRLDETGGWGIGTYTARSLVGDSEFDVPEEGEEGTHPGDYDITYEIRRTPLPDLKPADLQIYKLPDGRESVCVRLENVGREDAGAFDMNIHLDGTIIGSKRLIGGLPVGARIIGECIQTNLPGGLHKVSVFVDEGREVPEMDELNNELDTMCCVHVPGELPVLQPTGGPLPDLVVISLKVARQANGSDACEGGKTNYLFAQVKNAGPGAAGPFAVRVEVSGSLIKEKGSVPGLAAGAMVEVTIPTDDLKDGSQPVKVIADGDNQVGEQDEGNNAYQITANCV